MTSSLACSAGGRPKRRCSRPRMPRPRWCIAVRRSSARSGLPLSGGGGGEPGIVGGDDKGFGLSALAQRFNSSLAPLIFFDFIKSGKVKTKPPAPALAYSCQVAVQTTGTTAAVGDQMAN